MPEKVKFSDYKPAQHGTMSYDKAVDEVRREITVRKRLYDRWLDEGKQTFSEADDRLRGMMTALNYLLQHCNEEQVIKCDMAAKPF